MSKKAKHNQTAETNTPKPTPQNEDPIVKIAKINLFGAIITGILTLTGLTVTALLAPIVLEYFRHQWNAIPTPAITITETFTSLPSETSFVTEEFSTATSMAETFTPFPTDTPILPTDAKLETMTVNLQASALEGKTPFTVNFNARETSVRFANGNVATCGVTSFCTFTWTIFHNSKFADTITTNDGVFSYSFTKKGIYHISLYVCRGGVCEGGGTQFTAK